MVVAGTSGHSPPAHGAYGDCETDMNKISDPVLMAAVLAYCRERRIPCWVIHTPPESAIGGFSCELLSIDGDTAQTRIANGDVLTERVSELHMRVA
jgi:hypothetical protein